MRAAQEIGASVETVAAFRIPTDAPESDGTFAWDSSTIVVVELEAGLPLLPGAHWPSEQSASARFWV